ARQVRLRRPGGSALPGGGRTGGAAAPAGRGTLIRLRTHEARFQVKTVWKFDLPDIGSGEDTFEVLIPEDARLLTVQLQDGEPKLWALVDARRRPVPHRLRVAGTGHPLDAGSLHSYLGTVQVD